MPRPRRIAHQTPGASAPQWLVELTVAGRRFQASIGDPTEAHQAFHQVASRVRSGTIDRVVLWHGSSCIDAAVPGGPTARKAAPLANSFAPPEASVDPIDALLARRPALTPEEHRQRAAARSNATLADYERVCWCGARADGPRCAECPGPAGAGKELRSVLADQRLIARASPEDLGL